jgi:hypothetical protein
MKKKIHIYYLAAILLLTALLYSNSITNDFVNWDDDISVELNNDIISFSRQHVFNMFNNSYNGMYQPVVMLSFAVNYAIHGLQPEGYHTTNLLIHLLNVILVFVFIGMMFKNNTLSLITALVFAIHPMHVESVSWITERKDVVYAFFYLLSLIMYLKYIKTDYKIGYLLFSILFFLLSLFSKTNAVTLPLIIIAIDWYFKRKRSKSYLIEKTVFLSLAIVFGLIAIKSQQMLDVGVFKNVQYNIIDRLFIACHAFVFYIIKFLFPLHLSALYPFPLKPDGLLPLHYYASFLLLIAIVYAIVRVMLKKAHTEEWKKQLIFAAAFFVLSISIVIFIPVGKADVSDRYTYIPYICLTIFFYLLTELISLKWKKKVKILIGVIFLVFFSISVYQRNKVWQNSGTLWSDVIKKYPESEVAYYGRGNYKQSKKNFAGAMIDFNKAIDLNPEFALALNNRGAIKLYLRDLNGALIDLNKSAAIDPGDKWVYYNRALVYFNQGLNRLGCSDLEKSAMLGNKNAADLINKFCK